MLLWREQKKRALCVNTWGVLVFGLPASGILCLSNIAWAVREKTEKVFLGMRSICPQSPFYL